MAAQPVGPAAAPQLCNLLYSRQRCKRPDARALSQQGSTRCRGACSIHVASQYSVQVPEQLSIGIASLAFNYVAATHGVLLSKAAFGTADIRASGQARAASAEAMVPSIAALVSGGLSSSSSASTASQPVLQLQNTQRFATPVGYMLPAADSRILACVLHASGSCVSSPSRCKAGRHHRPQWQTPALSASTQQHRTRPSCSPPHSLLEHASTGACRPAARSSTRSLLTDSPLPTGYPLLAHCKLHLLHRFSQAPFQHYQLPELP